MDQTVEKLLYSQLVFDHPRTWHEFLLACVFAYNTTQSSTTKVSPFQLMFGRLPRIPIQALKKSWLRDTVEWPSLIKPAEEQFKTILSHFKVGADLQNEA